MSDSDSPFLVVSISLKMALLPSSCTSPMKSVKAQLSNMLFQYNEQLDGIPLAYNDVQFAEGKPHGRILGENPWLHCEILSKVVIFRPIVGSTIQGQISKISDSHASLLIFNMFNASISVDEIKKKYAFNYSTNSWEGNGNTLSEGDTIPFRVKSIQHANGIINISGVL